MQTTQKRNHNKTNMNVRISIKLSCVIYMDSNLTSFTCTSIMDTLLTRSMYTLVFIILLIHFQRPYWSIKSCIGDTIYNT